MTLFKKKKSTKLTLIYLSAFVKRPKVVCLEASGVRGTNSLSFSRQCRRCALLQLNNSDMRQRTKKKSQTHYVCVCVIQIFPPPSKRPQSQKNNNKTAFYERYLL